MNNLYGWDFPPVDLSNNYINKCKLFVQDETLFNNFRQDEDYTQILEGGGRYHGQIYLNKIARSGNMSVFQKHLSAFKENDLYGNPFVFEYDNLGKINNHTIMYASHTFDIRNFLQGFVPKKIVEIGGGYGGMCKTLSVLYNFDEYILVDLPDAINLAKKYLNHFPSLYKKITFIDCNQVRYMVIKKDIDLVIATFSLSECNEETQMLYTNRFLMDAKYAFIGYNKLHLPEVKNVYNKWLQKISTQFEVSFDRSIGDVVYLLLKRKGYEVS